MEEVKCSYRQSFKKNHIYRSFLVLLIWSACFFRISGEVVTYPAYPGAKMSPDFAVKVNNTTIWVERVGSPKPSFDYYLHSGRDMEDLNVVNFSCSGALTIKITASSKIEDYVIRPKCRGIKAVVKGKEMTFTIPGPQKLYIEINKLPHLAIFANPLEVNPPKEGDMGVVYYGPGTHNPGQINLQSNQTIYIAGGAIVNANVRGNNLQNVKILGRGSLQGNVRISGTTNFEVNGIFIRSTKGWTNTITNCHHSGYTNVKIFSYEGIWGLDGLDPVGCTNFKINDCFMRCRDDCVSIKTNNYDFKVDSISVLNCVMVGWSNADGVTIGYEVNGGPVQNVLVKNCDILYARGGGQGGGHSAFSIVSDGPAWVKNIRFEDIRVEENIEFKNFELLISDGTFYGNDLPGHIQDVYLKNVTFENGTKPIILNGQSATNLIENVTFDHCTSGGKLITCPVEYYLFPMYVNGFTKNVKFITD